MNIYLLGDSVRQHAEPYVRAALRPQQVFSPEENCRSSDVLLANLVRWAPLGPGDIVHINCGLHDIRYDAGRDAPVNSLEQYKANLIGISDYLTERKAEVVWASSTPFDESVHNRMKVSRRYYDDILRYNACAGELAESYGFVVHDLHGALVQAGFQPLLLPDGLHYNDAGNRFIGNAVAGAVRSRMPQE